MLEGGAGVSIRMRIACGTAARCIGQRELQVLRQQVANKGPRRQPFKVPMSSTFIVL